ncbi:hypothetical protein PS006_24800, partial [Shigella sonnei]|nr:hypothetical protein [Shigella sonnei]
SMYTDMWSEEYQCAWLDTLAGLHSMHTDTLHSTCRCALSAEYQCAWLDTLAGLHTMHTDTLHSMYTDMWSEEYQCA